jgi:serine/threonine protein kinase
MSKVFRAIDEKTGRRVCLKILDPLKTKRFEDRFLGLDKPTEGEISVQLRHLNVIQTHEFGLTSKGEMFLVMELVDGAGMNFLIETQSDILKGNRFDFLKQAAEGLGYIHQTGFIHRDICPRNLMVTHDNIVKIIDMGLTVPDTEEFRKPGNRTGSANYMAPEIIRRVTTDKRVDLFSLGVTAYELFTNHLPWEGMQSLQAVMNHINKPPVHPKEYRKDLDEELVKFILKSVDPNPKLRFQTCKDFKEALQKLPKQDY